jgi:hypothetical protein
MYAAIARAIQWTGSEPEEATHAAS